MESGKSFESRSAEDVTDYNTQDAVDNACTELGIDADLAVWCIIEYGAQNRTFHRDVDSLIADGNWRQLSLIFSSDLDDIDCVYSEIRTETNKNPLKTTIRNEINPWFDTFRDPNDINLWAPTQALYAEYQAAKARSGTTKAQKKAVNIAEKER